MGKFSWFTMAMIFLWARFMQPVKADLMNTHSKYKNIHIMRLTMIKPYSCIPFIVGTEITMSIWRETIINQPNGSQTLDEHKENIN